MDIPHKITHILTDVANSVNVTYPPLTDHGHRSVASFLGVGFQHNLASTASHFHDFASRTDISEVDEPATTSARLLVVHIVNSFVFDVFESPGFVVECWGTNWGALEGVDFAFGDFDFFIIAYGSIELGL